MATIRITSVNYNNESANITFYSENNPDIPVNLGLNIIPYTRTGSDVFGRYVLSFSSFGSVCEATIASPTTSTTSTTSTTTDGPTSSTTSTTTTSEASIFSMTNNSGDIDIAVTGIAIIDFDDGDQRVLDNESVSKKYNFDSKSEPRVWLDIASSDDGTKIVACTQSIVYMSSDGGETWTDILDGNYDFVKIAVSNNATKIALADRGGFILISNDSGVSWTPVASQLLWNNIAMSSDGTKLIASVYNEYVYFSSDGGSSWTAVIDDSPQYWSAVDISDDGLILAASVGSFVYYSYDYGSSWITGNTGETILDIAISRINQTIFVLCASKIVKFIYSGSSLLASTPKFLTSNSSGSISVSNFIDDKNKLLITHGNRLLASSDGINFYPKEQERVWKAAIVTRNGNKFIAVGSNTNVFISNDPFQQRNVTLSGNNFSISFPSVVNEVTSINSWGSLTNIDNLFFNRFPSLTSIPTNFNGIVSANYLLQSNRTAIAGNITINSNTLTDIENILNSNTNITGITINCNSILRARNAFYNSKISFANISNTSTIQLMNGMFYSCENLDQDFTGFNLSGLTTPVLDTFMGLDTQLSTINYNKLLYYWDQNKTNYLSNITIDMGDSVADTSSGGINGILSKFNLISYGWTIIDGQ